MKGTRFSNSSPLSNNPPAKQPGHLLPSQTGEVTRYVADITEARPAELFPPNPARPRASKNTSNGAKARDSSGDFRLRWPLGRARFASWYHGFMPPIRRWIGWSALAAAIMIPAVPILHKALLRIPARHGMDADFQPQVSTPGNARGLPKPRAAVASEGRSFARTVVLARQIEWDHGQPQTVRVAVDWARLKSTSTPSAGALRIDAYAGPFDSDTAQFVGKPCA